MALPPPRTPAETLARLIDRRRLASADTDNGPMRVAAIDRSIAALRSEQPIERSPLEDVDPAEDVPA